MKGKEHPELGRMFQEGVSELTRRTRQRFGIRY